MFYFPEHYLEKNKKNKLLGKHKGRPSALSLWGLPASALILGSASRYRLTHPRPDLWFDIQWQSLKGEIKVVDVAAGHELTFYLLRTVFP